MEGCDLCQQMKNRMEEVAGKLNLGEVLENPWTHISVDFITKLPIVRIAKSGLSFFLFLFIFLFSSSLSILPLFYF